MPFMTRIPSDLARFGLKVELVPGWDTRGSSSFAPACVVDHWTAGPRATKGRPSLSIVTYGRQGLDGPLCNIYLARDATCVVVAAGRANHAGPGGFRGLVGNSAAYGIEAESGGDGDWTPEMLDAYPRLNAALLSGLGRDASWVAGHCDWAPDRKIDIRDIVTQVRAKTAIALAHPSEELFTVSQYTDLVNLIQNNHRDMADAVWRGVSAAQSAEAMLKGNNPEGQNNFHWGVAQITEAIKSIPGAQVDEEQLRAAIASSVTFTEQAIATGVADEQDRRARDGDPATGPVS